MKISCLRTVLLRHDYAGELRLEWVGDYIDTWDAALVEVATADDVHGMGEVAQGIMTAGAVPGIVEALAPYVIGENVAYPTQVADRLRDPMVSWARGAICSGAIETALWDVAGKAVGRPVWELLLDETGPAHERVGLYASGGLETTTQQALSWAKKQEAAGLGAVKYRAMKTPERTSELIWDVVSGLRPGPRFAMDAVQGCASRPWVVEDTVWFGEVVSELGGRWFEEPCRAEDIGGYAEVHDRIEAPLSGVESYSSRHGFLNLVDRDGVDIRVAA